MKSFLPRLRSLNSTVIRLGFVSFFADISSEMLYPITPIFLTATLGASMISVGLIEGFAEGLASFLKLYSGAWSDRIQSRRRFVTAGYFLSAIAKPIIGVSTSWGQIFFARGLDRSGKGIRTPARDALISDTTEPSRLGEAFGWHRMMDTAGAALGPLLALLILENHVESFRSLYLWALIPGMIAVGITFFVQEPTRPVPEEKKVIHKAPFSEVTKNRNFRIYFYGWAVFSYVNSSDVFLILRAKQMGVSLAQTILLYCFYNLVYAFLSPYLGRLSDGTSRKRILSVGLTIFALVYSGFAFATHAWHFWVLFGIYGIYMAATDGVGKALAVRLLPKELKATGLGLLGASTGVCTVLASAIGGLLWDRFGASALFLYGAIGAVLASFLLLLIQESDVIKN